MAETYLSKWTKCQSFIRDNIGETLYDRWFANTRAISFSNDVLTLLLPSHYCFEMYETDYYNVLSSAVLKEFGNKTRIDYKVKMIEDPTGEVILPQSGKSRIVGSKLDMANARPVGVTAPNEKDSVFPKFDSQLNPALNFENYCVGDSNRLAYTIAQSIAEKPVNNDFNPFFLYGDVGVGKTHLVEAIGISVREQNPYAKVLYTTARQFQHLYAQAVMAKQVPNFINWFMALDVLILDDLQEIEHKVKTSEMLFPIFNHLHMHGRQLIFTCDRPPMELDGVTDRLIDRFKWGLTEKLPAPDYEMRKKILTYKAKRNGLELPEDVIDFVASHAVNSVREIEGIVMGILTRSISLAQPITLSLARDVVRHTVKIKPQKRVNFDMIVEATAEYYKLNPDVIFSKSRVRDIADARQVIMYLCNKHTDLSSNAIGRKLNREHNTVLHGIATIRDRISVSTEMVKTIESIESDLR